MSILRVVHDNFGERTARVGEVKANIKKIVSWTPPLAGRSKLAVSGKGCPGPSLTFLVNCSKRRVCILPLPADS